MIRWQSPQTLIVLAREGMTFRQAFCQSAVCAPSRASLMTGLRPDSTRVWHLGDKFREINPETVTMPQYFSRYGYHTVNIGKIFHNYMPDSISWDEPDLRPLRYVRSDWLGRDGETFYISKEVNNSQEGQKRFIVEVTSLLDMQTDGIRALHGRPQTSMTRCITMVPRRNLQKKQLPDLLKWTSPSTSDLDIFDPIFHLLSLRNIGICMTLMQFL